MKKQWLFLFGMALLVGAAAAFATDPESTGTAVKGIGSVADTARTNLEGIARLITAASYVAGMAFVVGAIVKFKAHKDNPTQIPIGTPIALLFVGAALLFVPSVMKTSGATLFVSGQASSLSGVTKF